MLPAERDIFSVKGCSELVKQFPEVLYSEVLKASASKPSILKAYASQSNLWERLPIPLHGSDCLIFPSEFEFPNLKERIPETIFDGKKPKKEYGLANWKYRGRTTNFKIGHVYSSKNSTTGHR